MAINYSSWSVERLNKEVEKIRKVISVKEARDKKETLAKVTALARKGGFELHELVDGEGKKPVKATTTKRAVAKVSKKRGKVPPKYKNPANTSETWTGRGRQPLWIKEYVKSGGSLEDVTI